MTSRLRTFVRWYNATLEKYPRITKSVTAATIASAGDFACQTLQGEDLEYYDLPRTARMAIFNLGMTPLVHHWYLWLRVAQPASVARRVALDQLLWAPWGTAAFFFGISMMETKGDVNIGIERVSERTWPTLKANWVIWPLVQFFNFSYVPQQFQVLFVNSVSFFWSAYLSKMANPIPHQHDAKGHLAEAGGQLWRDRARATPGLGFDHGLQLSRSPLRVAAAERAPAGSPPLPGERLIASRDGHVHSMERGHVSSGKVLESAEDVDGTVHAEERYGVAAGRLHKHEGHEMGRHLYPEQDLLERVESSSVDPNSIKVPWSSIAPAAPKAHPVLQPLHPERAMTTLPPQPPKPPATVMIDRDRSDGRTFRGKDEQIFLSPRARPQDRD